MAITIEDACDILRGRVRRLAGKDGQRRLLRVAHAMGVSPPTLYAFLNDDQGHNMTTKSLRSMQLWCDNEERRLAAMTMESVGTSHE